LDAASIPFDGAADGNRALARRSGIMSAGARVSIASASSVLSSMHES
jgi:hypothetical protein